MGPPSTSRCSKCGEHKSTIQNFLLQCSVCNDCYHHRCHQPRVEDSVLTSLIKAWTDGDYANSFANWKCYKCKPRQSVIVLDDDAEVAPTVPQRPHPTTETCSPVIDLTISDSDESVKPEQHPVSLPHPFKFNLAPDWVYAHYLEQRANTQDRLEITKRSHRPNAKEKPLAQKSTNQRDHFVFSASAWFKSRKTFLA